MKPKRPGYFALLTAPLLILSGCATSALWEEGRFARFHEPAMPPNIEVFQSRQRDDLLVRYDETREGDGLITPRAYWLDLNHEPAKNPHKPRFVAIQEAQSLTPVQVVDEATTILPLDTVLYVVVSTNAQDFTLYSRERFLGMHELPVYPDKSGRMKQVLLTPFAFVADLTIVGGVLAYVCLPGSWESLNYAVR